MRQPYKGIGWPIIIGLILVVVAFMVLSLLVTATGTARIAVAMGYDARVGYAVGAIFDIAKGILPVALLALLAQRALGAAILLGIPWIGLVTFSCLATHATVSAAIASIERTGTWKMEDGSTGEYQGGAVQCCGAAWHPEPSHAAPAGQDGARGAVGGARAS
jgi:hypothetical protein